MTIHSAHPFLPGEDGRDPLRRLRGRMPAPVSVWTTGSGPGRVGWTVSSFLLADGDPAEVLGLLDEESDLADALADRTRFVVNLLGPGTGFLADAFAGLAPSPGGPFRLGTWRDTEWGPVLDGAVGWLGAERVTDPPSHAGWALLVRGTVRQAELTRPDEAVLGHVRGRYRDTPADA